MSFIWNFAFSTDGVFIEVGWNFNKLEIPMHLDRISNFLWQFHFNVISPEFEWNFHGIQINYLFIIFIFVDQFNV